MSSMFVALDRAIGRLVNALACALLLGACLVALWQVLARYVLQAPSDWTEVLVRTMLVWCVYLGIALAFRRGALVSVDLLRSRLSGTAAKSLNLVLTTLSALFLFLVAVLGAQLAWLTRFQQLAGLEIPMAWAYAAIPVGSVVAILGVLAHHVDPAHRELETSL